MVLLIGETIGWQELIFIGILALIFLGPRKLPQMARTIGKYMAEFRRAANEFKSTWESEVSTVASEFKEELRDNENDMRMLARLETPKPVENSIGRNQTSAEENGSAENGNTAGGTQLELPMVKEVEASQIPGAQIQRAQDQNAEETVAAETAEPARESKKDWL